MVRNGTNHGQPQARCHACGQTVSLRFATAYVDLRCESALFETAVRALAQGTALRATGRILQIDKDTACAWLDCAARHARLVMLALWQNLPVVACQLHELWSFVHTKDRNLQAASRCCADYGDAWVWLAVAPRWRLVLAFVVGKPTQQQADLLLQRVVAVTDERIPFFTSDQLAEYPQALLNAYGQWVYPPRKGTQGRYPAPRLLPPEDLVYAQVVKTRERGRVVAVQQQLVFGRYSHLAEHLVDSPTTRTVNTSFVERGYCPVNAGSQNALVDLLGKPLAESHALCIPTAIYPFPGGPALAYRFIRGATANPLCALGWKALGVLELTALPSIKAEYWIAAVQATDALLVQGGDVLYLGRWMRESGLADLLPALPETVYVGVSAGSMVTAPIFGETYDDPQTPFVIAPGLGLVDFAVLPHLDHADHPDGSTAKYGKHGRRRTRAAVRDRR